MRIEVRLCETLARSRRRLGPALALTLRDGATVADALARLRLPHAGFRVALCNGADLLAAGAIDSSRRLADGDHLVLAAASDSPVRLPSFLARLSGLLSLQAQTS